MVIISVFHHPKWSSSSRYAIIISQVSGKKNQGACVTGGKKCDRFHEIIYFSYRQHHFLNVCFVYMEQLYDDSISPFLTFDFSQMMSMRHWIQFDSDLACERFRHAESTHQKNETVFWRSGVIKGEKITRPSYARWCIAKIAMVLIVGTGKKQFWIILETEFWYYLVPYEECIP